MVRDKKKLRFHQPDGERKEEAEVAKKVVIDHASMREAVRVIREFEKEYGVSILNRKGLDQASVILKKSENEDKLQNFVVNLVDNKITEKIAPIDRKINTLTDMISAMMTPQQKDEQEEQEHGREQPIPRTPDYVRKKQQLPE